MSPNCNRYYEDGNFGIRIENLVLVREANTPHTFGDRKYLEFETITFVPMQRKMMNEEIMTAVEKQWINAYHAEVCKGTNYVYTEKQSSACIECCFGSRVASGPLLQSIVRMMHQ